MNSLITTTAGSLAELATSHNLADLFTNVQVIVVADRSASTSERDCEGGKSRHEVIDQMLRELQRDHPGKVLLIAFNDNVEVQLGGILPPPDGTTRFVPALQKAIELCAPGMRVWFLSDGEADEKNQCDEEKILALLRKSLHGKISFGFAGERNSEGARFLRKMAEVANGECDLDLKTVKALRESAERALLTEGKR